MSDTRIAIVTGGSRGIGRNTVISLAERGVDLIFTYNARRDAAIGAAALWLSGVVSLALFAQYYWFGLAQMGAGILVFLWYRALRSRIE